MSGRGHDGCRDHNHDHGHGGRPCEANNRECCDEGTENDRDEEQESALLSDRPSGRRHHDDHGRGQTRSATRQMGEYVPTVKFVSRRAVEG